MNERKRHLFEMRVTADWLGRVDGWRTRSDQTPMPTRSSAVRQLVDQAIFATSATKIGNGKVQKSDTGQIMVPVDLVAKLDDIRHRAGQSNSLEQTLRLVIDLRHAAVVEAFPVRGETIEETARRQAAQAFD